MTDVPDLADLAAETRWVARLARRLVSDVHLSEDLAQDALVAALEHGGAVRSWRGFFGTTLRRRLYERRREDASRRARERAAGRGEALPSTLAMVERASVQRDLVAAVLELEEPYRTMLLWRFFEDLPPRAIARRAGVPVATVHTRLQRGLARLRARLERTHGDRAWVVALLPLTELPRGAPWLGAALVKTSTEVVLTSLLLAGGVVLVARLLARDERASDSPAAVAAFASKEEGLRAPSVPLELPEAREPLSAGSTPAGTEEKRPAAPPPAARELAGIALDVYGRGLSGVELAARPGGERFTSGAGGRFRLVPRQPAAAVESADERYATVLAGAGGTTAESGAVVVLAPRLELAGRVVDEGGTDLAGVELSVRVPRGFGADFGLALDGALTRTWTAVSDERGGFRLPDVPAIPAAELVRGVVLLPDGTGAEGARVSFGLATTVAGARGRFELAAEQDAPPAAVIALAPGYLPALARRSDFEGGWPDELVLRLGGDAGAIAGHVRGADGVPVPHARVWLADPTWFGGVEGDVTSCEALAGRDDRRFWAFVETDGSGAFELGGLLPRAYRLKALDPSTLLLVESEAIAAGTRGVELVLPARALFERVGGRVVAADGQGLAGVSVVAQRLALEYTFPDGGTRDQFVPRPAVTTDAEGGFELADVPREGVELFAHGDTILFASLAVEPTLDPERVRIVAERRIHLQVELDPPHGRADSLRVLDGDGRGLLLRVMRGSTAETNPVARIEDGRSHVLSLGERARWVVLYSGAAEVARLPFAPAPDGVNLVRW